MADPAAVLDGGSSGGRMQTATPRGGTTPESARDRPALKAGAAASLQAPLPNLFKATFAQASKTCKGEQWLRQRVDAFDSANKQGRKRILEEFLDYVRDGAASSLEELFGHQVHLFFVRLTAWFSVTLPMTYELPLQLKVFLTFLEFREQAFVRAFFESGAFVPLMRTLSGDFDAPDEVRCLAMAVLNQLASHGRQHKELMCSQGLVPNVMECVVDGLRWETLKYAGRLLCELLHSNPLYQAEVLDALQDFLSQSYPLTQRIGAQAFVSLLAGRARALPASLRDPARWQELVVRAMAMLRGGDLRVGADAYCLLCHLVRTFGCDRLLFPFAHEQLSAEQRRTDDWLRVELEAKRAAADEEERQRQGPGTSLLLDRIHRKVAEALEAQQRALQEEAEAGSSELGSRLRRSSEEFSRAFKAEAGHILQWGLMMYLAKRNSSLCSDLVEGGLTEMLLMCLLDSSRPVRQAAALQELHQLRALVPKANRIAEAVLMRRELLQALTFEQFARAADEGTLSRARFRLRNLRGGGAIGSDLSQARSPADEQHVRSRLLNASKEASGAPAFLTEAAGREDADAAALAAAQAPPPPPGPEGGALELEGRHLINHVPFCGSLASFLTDPLDLTADESSPLIQELRGIGASVGFGARLRALLGQGEPRPTPRRAALAPELKKPSHRDGAQKHSRALALCTTIERRPTVRPALSAALPDRAESRMTDISVRMSDNEFLGVGAMGRKHMVNCACKVCAPIPSYMDYGASAFFDSLQATTVGQSYMEEDFSEMQSCEPCEPSLMAPSSALVSSTARLAAGESSIMSVQDDGVVGQDDLLSFLGIKKREGEPSSTVTERSRIAAMEELVYEAPAVSGESPAVPSSKKKVLHLAAAPYHQCVAFDPEAIEKERAQASNVLPQELDPGVRARFQDIKQVGSFPRKWLQGHEGRGAALKPGSKASSTGPSSARGASRGRRLHELSAHLADWHLVPGAAVSQPLRTPRDMVDYFPASARS